MLPRRRLTWRGVGHTETHLVLTTLWGSKTLEPERLGHRPCGGGRPGGAKLSHATEDGRELYRHSTILHHLVPEEKASHEWVQASDNLFTEKTGQTTLLSYKDRSVDPTTHCSLDKFSFLSFKSSLFLGWSIRMGCEYSKIERNIYFGLFVFNVEMINVSSVFFGFLGARTVFVTFSFLWPDMLKACVKNCCCRQRKKSTRFNSGYPMPIQGFQGPLQAHQGMAIFESTYSLDNMQAGAGMMEAVYSQPTSPADTKGPQSCL